MEDTGPDFSTSASRNNPPGEIFASPRYITAQLASALPEHLPPIAIAALPYVPQFGSHFGLDLITKEIVKVCEVLAREQCNTVLHIPITRQWPYKAAPQPQVVAPSNSQVPLTGVPVLWGYYAVKGKAETVPIVKSKRRPQDEWLLNDELKEEFGKDTAVQVLFKDIFTLLWYIDRGALYDSACLNCLYPREWVVPGYERHNRNVLGLPKFEAAMIQYHKRTSNGDLDDSFGYPSESSASQDMTAAKHPLDVRPPMSRDERVIRYLSQLDAD
ncbi:hypothetical protein F4818DRAFT_441244 [Hypoxylon cercidicola]|nr:hypothetical protein F4818DRAFT_441244 [Hypoxylon cercidicola]